MCSRRNVRYCHMEMQSIYITLRNDPNWLLPQMSTSPHGLCGPHQISQNHGIARASAPRPSRESPSDTRAGLELPPLNPNSPVFLPLLTYLPDERRLLAPPRARLFVLLFPFRQHGALLRGLERCDVAYKRGRASKSVCKPTTRVECWVLHPQTPHLRDFILGQARVCQRGVFEWRR